MIETKWLVGFSDDLSDAYELRKTALGFGPDKDDEDSFVLVAYEEGKPIATGRLYINDDICELGVLAVAKEKRGEGVGDFVARILIRRAFDRGFKTQRVRSCENAVKFYEKLGFKTIAEDDGYTIMEREGDITGVC
jgi:ribosomal protein S18 acetylase RimI-like enzyme